MNLPVFPWPGHAVQALVVDLPVALEQLPSPAWLVALLAADAPAPVRAFEACKGAVRDLLRGHGYRPTGRGKPSSEYLAGAVAEGRLGSINAVVDVGNAASLHSGLPISVVDLALCERPLRIDVPPPGSGYVFNRGGQTIDVAGLPCLFDAQGPCANAVKDAQRSKTTPATQRVLAVVWGVQVPDGAHAAATVAWLRDLFGRLGARVSDVTLG